MEAEVGFFIVVCLLALYLAANLGANDVANSMGTSVGSGAVGLRQALMIAGGLEFLGAVGFGQNVAQKLATGVVNPALFTEHPRVLLLGMLAILLTVGIWLNLATVFGLPVSSSHAVVGALTGFGALAAGGQAVHWQSLGLISLTWVLTPMASGAIAALFYYLIDQGILAQPNALQYLEEWTPWLSAGVCTVFGVLILPPISQPLTHFFGDRLGWPFPSQNIALILFGTVTIGMTLTTLQWLAQQQNLASSAEQRPLVERSFARWQVLSACGVAFAHGSNDVGNAVAPLVVIIQIQSTGRVPLMDLPVPLWILLLGGGGIVLGLAIGGARVIRTIGVGIVSLQASSGFCAELATAITVLLASRLSFPVSTSHALVGAVVGVGLVQAWRSGPARPTGQSLQWATLANIALAWGVTIPVAAALGALIFGLLEFVWG